jgi:hypothetical protein
MQRSLKVKPSKRIIFFLPIKQSRQFFHHKQAPCAHAPCTKRQVGEKWVSDDCSYLCKGLLNLKKIVDMKNSG